MGALSSTPQTGSNVKYYEFLVIILMESWVRRQRTFLFMIKEKYAELDYFILTDFAALCNNMSPMRSIYSEFPMTYLQHKN